MNAEVHQNDFILKLSEAVEIVLSFDSYRIVLLAMDVNSLMLHLHFDIIIYSALTPLRDW